MESTNQEDQTKQSSQVTQNSTDQNDSSAQQNNIDNSQADQNNEQKNKQTHDGENQNKTNDGQGDKKTQQRRRRNKKPNNNNNTDNKASPSGEQKPMYRVKRQANDDQNDDNEERKADQNQDDNQNKESSRKNQRVDRRRKNKANQNNQEHSQDNNGEEQDDQESKSKNKDQTTQNRKKQNRNNQDNKQDQHKDDQNQERKEKKRSEAPTQYMPYQSKRKFTNKYAQYMAAEWKYTRRPFVTLDTVVPQKPEKEAEEPDQTAYNLKLADIDERIEKLNKQFEESTGGLKTQLKDLKKDNDGEKEVKAELKAHFEEMAIYKGQKLELNQKIEAINKKLDGLDREKGTFVKKMHPQYTSHSKVKQAISEMENRLETTTLDQRQEKKLIQEIDKLKQSEPFLNQIDEINQQIKQLRDDKGQLLGQLKDIKKITSHISQEIDKSKQKESEIMSSKQVVYKELDKVSFDLKKQRKKLYEEKDKMRNEHYTKLIDFEQYKQIINDIKWIEDTKNMVIEREDRRMRYEAQKEERAQQRQKEREERKKRDEERKQQEIERQKIRAEKQQEWEQEQLKKLATNPYQTELDLCYQLIYFCAKNTIREEGEKNVENGPISEVQADEEARKKKIEDSIKGGKLVATQTKDERLNANNPYASLALGPKGKKKKDASNKPVVHYEEETRLNLDYVMIKKFSKLGFAPPIDQEELPALQKKIKALQDALEHKGKIEQLDGQLKFTKNNKKDAKDEETKETPNEAQEDRNKAEQELKKMQDDFQVLDLDLKRQVSMISQDKINWDAVDDEDEGYHIDDIEEGQVIEDTKPKRRNNDSYQRPQANRGGKRSNQDQNQSKRGKTNDMKKYQVNQEEFPCL